MLSFFRHLVADVKGICGRSQTDLSEFRLRQQPKPNLCQFGLEKGKRNEIFAVSGTNADKLHVNGQSDRRIIVCQVLLIVGFGNGPQRNVTLPALSGMTLLHGLKHLKDSVSIKAASCEVSTHFHRIR